MAWNPSVQGYLVASRLVRGLPRPARTALVHTGAAVARRASPERRLMVERNLARVRGTDWGRRDVAEAFRSYGWYWAESFRLPTMGVDELDGRFSFEGYGHIVAARAAGYGPLMVIPHLGGWEWAAFWLTRVEGVGVTAVVEPLDPPELFEWFVSFRRALGMHVVPLGSSAAAEVVAGVRRLDVVCLLADRDLVGNGAEVEFFGERTTLPSGPALLALRTGAPLLPCAVYFEGAGLKTVVRPPVPVERRGSLRQDVERITQSVARELESLVARAPAQWHLMEPNWPSDHEALARAGT